MSEQLILTEYAYNLKTGETNVTWTARHHGSGLEANRGGTTLEQVVSLKKDSFGRHTPAVALDDFPQGLSEREAMLKLADWLHRIGVAIEDHFGTA